MVRIIFIFVVLGLIAGGVYGFYLRPKLEARKSGENLKEWQKGAGSSANAQADLVSPSVGRIGTNSAMPQASDKDVRALQQRMDVVEAAINKLQDQVAQFKKSGAVVNKDASSKSPLYIPIGAAGSSTSTAWTTLTQPQVTIDPGSYTGYVSMQLQITLRVYQANGKAHARLIDNSTDGQVVVNSEVETSMGSYTYLASKPFRLPSGSRTYKIQLLTETGYSADFQDARIVVNF